MNIREKIDMAGGLTQVARACTNKGMPVSVTYVQKWGKQNRLPPSDWLGTTQYAAVICDLIKALGREETHPLDLCPGAGQYMQQQDAKAA